MNTTINGNIWTIDLLVCILLTHTNKEMTMTTNLTQVKWNATLRFWEVTFNGGQTWEDYKAVVRNDYNGDYRRLLKEAGIQTFRTLDAAT